MRASATRIELVLAAALAAGSAACGSHGSSAPPACDLDPSLTADECAALEGLAYRADLPPSPGNAKADDLGAAHLGFAIFFDARFSSNQQVRCATCHLPESHFDDAKTVSVGLSTVTRNSPTVLNAAKMTGFFFWDGRADSLWSQPLFAFENPKEMNFTRLEIAHRMATTFASQYTPVFGALPPLDDTTRFPPAGKPGDPAFDRMSAADKDAVNRIAANVGKAMEAYERHLAAGASAFDRFLGGDQSALTSTQRHGMILALRDGCFDCHGGRALTDEAFRNLGVPALAGTDPDRGRYDGIATLRANPFNLQGPYADGAPGVPGPADPTPADLGAFRTPTLRNVALSAPYGHNGGFAKLEDIVRFHLKGGGRGGAGFVGDVDAKLVAHDASDQDVADIVDFLGALNGDYPAAPWNNWPQR